MGLLLSRWQAGGGALGMALAVGGGLAALGLLAIGAAVFRRRA
jgi:hypothetical protein